MTTVLDRLAEHRVIPIATGGIDSSNADAIADALIAGGLPLIEITLRAPGSLGAVARLAKRGDIFVSTGTVLTLDHARASLDAGAAYMVAPGLDMKIVEWARDHDFPFVPGATSASEATQAYNAGLRVMKFFPAEAAGGVPAMNLLAGPFAGTRFIPTGGITLQMLGAYLACPHVLAIGQGAMLKRETVVDRRYDQIQAQTQRTHEFIRSLPVAR